MIFSQAMVEIAEKRFEALLEQAGERKKKEIISRLTAARRTMSDDVMFAVKWLYANSPLSDMASYDFAIFLSCAEHGVFLRTNPLFAEEIPEELFLQYVLHIRVNEEELCDCRKIFYSLVSGRVRGRSMYDAAMEANYWNAEHVTYQFTDERTASALSVYRSGYGRCGEESTFSVNVFRALGIPARQIYTPRWAHCDDNHAWVEVWCGGRWYYLGACEPEEALDRGWFTNAAGRAMLIHSRSFGEISGEEIIARSGMVSFFNHLKRYAAAKRIFVTVKDERGAIVKDAEVSFGILNGSDIFPAAVMYTGDDGIAALTCGVGTIYIDVRKGELSAGQIFYTTDADTVEITLKRELPASGRWEKLLFVAPADSVVSVGKLTKEQKELGEKKAVKASEKQRQRMAAMQDIHKIQALVKAYGYSHAIEKLLLKSGGNMEELIAFLKDERFSAHEKEALLLTLSEKDWRDVDPDVLWEALSFVENCADREESIFYPYIVCPRILHEPLFKYRTFISDFFSDKQKAAFRAEPERIWDYISENIDFIPAIEYGQIVTGAVGALTVRKASLLSRKLLFVAICRTLCIAARLNPVDQMAEYYKEGRFHPVEIPQSAGMIILEKKEEETWQYYRDYTVGWFVGGRYQTLDLTGIKWEDGRLRVAARAGKYRIITSNRLPNGNVYAETYHFCIESGEEKRIGLEKSYADLKDMLGNFAIEEFVVYDETGQKILGSELTRDRAVLMWLEEGREPTEHILDEMLGWRTGSEDFPVKIICIVKGKKALGNAKLQKVLRAFDTIWIFYDSFMPNVEVLARRLYVDHEKLPLIMVVTGKLHVVYAISGYQVGSWDMLRKICGLVACAEENTAQPE